jgi:hypothetical protein
MSRELLRATISSTLSKTSVKSLDVAGVTLFVRGLTGAERVVLQKWAAEAQAGGEPVADHRIAALGLCDADGVRLYDDEADVAKLDGAALGDIAKAILEASGLTDAASESAPGN